MDFISHREKPSWELQGRASAGVVALQQQGHFHRASSWMPMPCACSGGPKIKQNRIKCLFLLLLCHGKKRQVSTNQCGTRSRVVPGLQQRQQKVSLVVTFEFPLASRPLSLNQAHSPHMQVCFVLFFFPCSWEKICSCWGFHSDLEMGLACLKKKALQNWQLLACSHVPFEINLSTLQDEKIYIYSAVISIHMFCSYSLFFLGTDIQHHRTPHHTIRIPQASSAPNRPKLHMGTKAVWFLILVRAPLWPSVSEGTASPQHLRKWVMLNIEKKCK